MYEYRAIVLRHLDGDTAQYRVDLGFRVHVEATIRLLGSKAGVDTPEDKAGLPAKARVMAVMPANTQVTLRTQKPADKMDGGFGRWLAQVLLPDGTNLGDMLMDEGLAVEYRR